MKKICIRGPSSGAEIAQLVSAVLAIFAFSAVLYMVSSFAALAVFCGVVGGLVFGVASCAKGEIVFEETP
jgi:hypothetical protein